MKVRFRQLSQHKTHMNAYFLKSQRIGLRPLRPDDAVAPYLDWLNDSDVCHGNDHHRLPYGISGAREYIAAAETTRTDLILAIEMLDTGTHIGNIALQNINPIHRSADFSILIGNREFWGTGCGIEAGTLLVRHGFQELNLQRIGCGTPSYNEGMIKLALALGMKEEGRRRQAFFKHGEYHDLVEFGVLASEFAQ